MATGVAANLHCLPSYIELSTCTGGFGKLLIKHLSFYWNFLQSSRQIGHRRLIMDLTLHHHNSPSGRVIAGPSSSTKHQAYMIQEMLIHEGLAGKAGFMAAAWNQYPGRSRGCSRAAMCYCHCNWKVATEYCAYVSSLHNHLPSFLLIVCHILAGQGWYLSFRMIRSCFRRLSCYPYVLTGSCPKH